MKETISYTPEDVLGAEDGSMALFRLLVESGGRFLRSKMQDEKVNPDN